MMLQRSFFPLPTPTRIAITREQLGLLDLIALRNGLPLGELALGQRGVLRRLLGKKLVECRTLGPAVYLVTPVGRMVRGRAR